MNAILSLIFGIAWGILFILRLSFRTWRAYEGEWKILEFAIIFLNLVLSILYFIAAYIRW